MRIFKALLVACLVLARVRLFQGSPLNVVLTRYPSSTKCTVRPQPEPGAPRSKPGTCTALHKGAAVPRDCISCNSEAYDCSKCAWCTKQTEQMDPAIAHGSCVKSNYKTSGANHYLRLTCEGAYVKCSVFLDDKCVRAVELATGADYTNTKRELVPINVKLQNLTVLSNGVCTDIQAEFLRQLRNDMSSPKLSALNKASFQEAIMGVTVDFTESWSISAQDGRQLCQNKAVNETRAFAKDAKTQYQAADKFARRFPDKKTRVGRAADAANYTAYAAYVAALRVVDGFAHNFQGTNQTVLQAKADKARKLAVEAAAESTKVASDSAATNGPPKGVQLVMSRYFNNSKCHGTCKALIPGQTVNDLSNPDCVSQTMWIDRTKMDACIPNAYAANYYTLHCAGQEVLFSLFTDSDCTTPLAYNVGGGKVAMKMKDLIVHDDGNCTNMNLEYINMLIPSKSRSANATSNKAVAAVVSQLKKGTPVHFPYQSLKIEPSVPDWCSAPSTTWSDSFVDVTITRYTSNNNCLKEASSGSPTQCVSLVAGKLPPANCHDCKENCGGCSDCTVMTERLDMKNMHGKCTKSAFAGALKLTCDGPNVQFSRFVDVNCTQPIFVDMGAVLKSGKKLGVEFTGFSVYDNGVCTNMNEQYVQQLYKASLLSSNAEDKAAYKKAITNVPPASWSILATSNKQFCPQRTAAQAQKAADTAQARAVDAAKILASVKASGAQQGVVANAKASAYLANASSLAARNVVKAVNTANQSKLQRIADHAATQAADASAELTRKIVNQQTAANDRGLTVVLSRYTNSSSCDPNTKCIPLSDGDGVDVSTGDIALCTTQNVTVDRTEMGQCIRSQYDNDHYTLTCAGEDVLFTDYGADSSCTVPKTVEFGTRADGHPIMIRLEQLSVNEDGQCTDMCKEYQARLTEQMRQAVVDKVAYQNAIVVLKATCRASWTVVPSKSNWCAMPTKALDSLPTVEITRYPGNNNCNPVDDDGERTNCTEVKPGMDLPVDCHICYSSVRATGDSEDDCRGCSWCTKTVEQFDIANMHGKCIQSQYSTAANPNFLKLTCDGPDVMFSTYDDEKCLHPAMFPTGYHDNFGQDINIKLLDLKLLDNGVCTDLNAEYTKQLIEAGQQHPTDPWYRHAIDTVHSFTQSWTVAPAGNQTFCPARNIAQETAVATEAARVAREIESACRAARNQSLSKPLSNMTVEVDNICGMSDVAQSAATKASAAKDCAAEPTCNEAAQRQLDRDTDLLQKRLNERQVLYAVKQAIRANDQPTTSIPSHSPTSTSNMPTSSPSGTVPTIVPTSSTSSTSPTSLAGQTGTALPTDSPTVSPTTVSPTVAQVVCADAKESGISGQPCGPTILQYCDDALFSAVLAQNCPKTCGKCLTPPCMDNAESGVKDQPCGDAIIDYCDDPEFRNILAQTCPLTCGRCQALCSDAVNSGIINLPCGEHIRPYCHEAVFSEMLAKNCPRTCATCSSVHALPSPTTTVPTKVPLQPIELPASVQGMILALLIIGLLALLFMVVKLRRQCAHNNEQALHLREIVREARTDWGDEEMTRPRRSSSSSSASGMSSRGSRGRSTQPRAINSVQNSLYSDLSEIRSGGRNLDSDRSASGDELLKQSPMKFMMSATTVH